MHAQKTRYRDETIWIIPITKDHFPGVAICKGGSTQVDPARLLLRFLSTLAWVEEAGYLVDSFSGGSLPRPMGREKTFGFSIREEFDFSYFPEPEDERALLALALMREGRGLNHAGYAFLSFYRVLELAIPNGKRRGEWIDSHLDSINDHGGKDALSKLRARRIDDIGVHLRDSGRRAIAHARKKPIIDPDDPADNGRLLSELPIIRSLAQMAIEEFLGVETSHTVWQKHLYELAGFKEIFGDDIVCHLTEGMQIPDGTTVDIPPIDIRLRRHQPYAPLSNLTVVGMRQEGCTLQMRFASVDRNIEIRFKLDFANERLAFDLFDGIYGYDTGAAESALAIAELKRFSHDYFGNGELEIYNGETGSLISRKDAFIPMNMFLDHEKAEAEVVRWIQIAEERRNRA